MRRRGSVRSRNILRRAALALAAPVGEDRRIMKHALRARHD